MNKLKILHINASDTGSTGNIVIDICAEANKRGYRCASVFPRKTREKTAGIKEFSTSLRFEQGVYKRLCAFYGLRYGIAPLSTAKILNIIRREKPDLVHLHSVNCYTVNIYRLLGFLKKRQIPTVITNHAEFFYTGGCPHALDCERWKTGCGSCPDVYYASDSILLDRTHTAFSKMKKLISEHGNLTVTSVSPWVYNRSAISPIMEKAEQRLIINGVNTSVFNHTPLNAAREKLGISPEDKILLNVTANFSDKPEDMKGGIHLIELAKRVLPLGIKVFVAGKHSDIKDIPENLILLGRITDQRKLALYYAAANLTVLTSRRETFGMAVAESLSCGTPVVGFESGGSESISIEEFSSFTTYGNIDLLCNLVSKWVDFKTEENSLVISNKAKLKYSAELMAEKYCDLYEEMVRKD